MIDLHMHVLPGVDDGAKDIEDALEMCRIASESGVRGIVATSHGNLMPALSAAKYKEAYRFLKQELKNEEIPIRLYIGMEIFMDADAVSQIENSELLTLNGTRYVLVEFDFGEDLWMVNEYIQMLQESGYIPVIAHAERYQFVQAHPEEVFRWVENDCVIQVNKGSLLGAFGKRERETAFSLLQHNLVHVIASDAHGTRKRTPNMTNIVRFLGDTVSPGMRKLLLSENPARILKGQDIMGFPPKPYRRNIYW